MTTKFLLANTVTGECVGSDMVKPLVGVLRKWVKEGMTEGGLMFAVDMDKEVMNYFRQVVRENRTSTCDFCGCEKKSRDMVYHCDSEDVCMVIECKECNEGSKF